MPLPSFLQRPPKDKAPGAAASPADEGGPVQAARTRARRRLVGAVVLLAAGVVGFPLLFETQPRPLPVDIPIEVARREGREPLPPPKPQPARPLPAPPAVVEAPVEKAPEPSPAVVPPPVVSAVPSAPASRVVVAAPSAPVVAAAPKPKPAAEPAPPKVVEEAAPSASLPAGRFVVQVGAYTDAAALRDARAKVEKLGLKTYTQAVETEAGKRTRVRVGPFATREEAAAAASKLKSAGLPANLLTL